MCRYWGTPGVEVGRGPEAELQKKKKRIMIQVEVPGWQKSSGPVCTQVRTKTRRDRRIGSVQLVALLLVFI